MAGCSSFLWGCKFIIQLYFEFLERARAHASSPVEKKKLLRRLSLRDSYRFDGHFCHWQPTNTSILPPTMGRGETTNPDNAGDHTENEILSTYWLWGF